MPKRSNIIFITGTDTAVGKTLLTALLLQHLRSQGVHALAMKPFCSGGLGDVRLLQSLQPGELTDDEMNPFYFNEPLAPLIAAIPGRRIRLENVVEKINAVARKCEVLLVEGSGGLLVPLGPQFSVRDLIAKLQCHVIVAARNRLGTINHTLLTIGALEQIGVPKRSIQIILMGVADPDLSAQSNNRLLGRLLPTLRIVSIPYLGRFAATKKMVDTSAAALGRLLSGCVRC